MDTALAVALISGGVALVSAGLTTLTAWRGRRLQAQLDSQKLLLQDELERRARAETKAEEAAKLMARYRDPLLRAAFDLQSRLYNILEQGFLATYYRHSDAHVREYARENTLYVLAEYLGWVEIVRREVSFLDLGDEQRTRELNDRLDRVRTALLTDHLPPAFMLFHGQQRAIGELMIIDLEGSGAGPQHACLGYAAFAEKHSDPSFARWFKPLREDLETAADRAVDMGRLVVVQRALVAVIDNLDPRCKLFPAPSREKLPLPDRLSWFEGRASDPLKAARDIETIRTAERDIAPIASAEPHVVGDLVEAYRTVAAWEEIARLAEELPPHLRRDPRIAQTLSFGLNRIGRTDEATEALRDSVRTRPGADTLRTLGLHHYKVWRVDPDRGADHLRSAVAAFDEAFAIDPSDPQIGFQLVRLAELTHPPDDKRAIVPSVLNALEGRLRGSDVEYFDLAMQLELALIAGDPQLVTHTLNRMRETPAEPWMLVSTTESIREVCNARGDSSPESWLEAAQQLREMAAQQDRT